MWYHKDGELSSRGGQGRAEVQCHIVFPHAHTCIISGADALGGVPWARPPPGRPVGVWKSLILRGKRGTGAAGCPLGRDRGSAHRINAEPRVRETMWHWAEACPHFVTL